MQAYLESSRYIDWESPEILDQARRLAEDQNDTTGIVKNCFEFVRDQIRHSLDFKLNPVTCRASDVLRHTTGYCYAKSHLLAALLRANGVPAGLCYQRLATK
ncbi:transglutaminase family protein, partial [bacterium]|nr:transglutaminase family protein [bacterium]